MADVAQQSLVAGGRNKEVPAIRRLIIDGLRQEAECILLQVRISPYLWNELSNLGR
jgi:hypothetical protein